VPYVSYKKKIPSIKIINHWHTYLAELYFLLFKNIFKKILAEKETIIIKSFYFLFFKNFTIEYFYT